MHAHERTYTASVNSKPNAEYTLHATSEATHAPKELIAELL